MSVEPDGMTMDDGDNIQEQEMSEWKYSDTCGAEEPSECWAIARVKELSEQIQDMQSSSDYDNGYRMGLQAGQARVKELEEKLYWAQGQWDRCLKRIAELSKALGEQPTG